MTTQAFIGHGAEIAVGSGSPVQYAAIGEVTSISGPSLARDAIDATHMASPGGWREFIPGLKDGGEITIEFNFVPGSQSYADLQAAFNSSDAVPFRLTFPDGSPGTTWTFDGIVTGLESDMPVDDKATGTMTVKLTGEPNFGP